MKSVLVLSVVMSLYGSASGVKGQGTTCDGRRRCPSGLTCTKTLKAVATCEIPCSPKKSMCPEDQRCVRDGETYVCRQIVDGNDR